MDRTPGRIGFMSTQRRVIRWRNRSCMGYAGLSGIAFPGLIARYDRAIASGGTAPPEFPAWFATNSLQSGFRIVQLDRLVQLLFVRFVQLVLLVRLVLRHGSPPFGAGPGGATGRPANHGFSLPHIPSPSGFARLHPTLPRVPAGRRRWAERYDGKGNLYLQHAA
jgi:hypothetical protein